MNCNKAVVHELTTEERSSACWRIGRASCAAIIFTVTHIVGVLMLLFQAETWNGSLLAILSVVSLIFFVACGTLLSWNVSKHSRNKSIAGMAVLLLSIFVCAASFVASESGVRVRKFNEADAVAARMSAVIRADGRFQMVRVAANTTNGGSVFLQGRVASEGDLKALQAAIESVRSPHVPAYWDVDVRAGRGNGVRNR